MGRWEMSPTLCLSFLERWKNWQIQKQTSKQKGDPSYFRFGFGESTSQVCPKCQFLGGKVFFFFNKQIGNWQFSAHSGFLKKEWMSNHTKGLESKSAADGVIWSLVMSHLFESRVLSGHLLYELSCWSVLSCQKVTSNYWLGIELSE